MKFYFHASGTTVCETKLSHHALVRPGQIQNLLALPSRVFEQNRRYEVEVLEKAISRIRIVLLLWETNERLKRARFNSKQRLKIEAYFVSPCLFSFLVLALVRKAAQIKKICLCCSFPLVTWLRTFTNATIKMASDVR